jgi:hypothetical protein
LGTFAPFAIMLILVIWVVALVLGFGLVFHALADDFEPRLSGYFSGLYVAGITLLTIGYGDIVPVGAAARLVTLLAGVSGLAVVALVISMTFNLYESFARREVLVLLLAGRAGSPPSGVTLLETYGAKRIEGQLAELFAQYETWAAEMLDSHLAYPILPFFRSSHEGQSWVSALGAVLDAATLLITAVEPPDADAPHACRARAAGEMMYQLGCHVLADLAQLRATARMRPAAEPGIERAEFEAACDRLTEAGFRLRGGDAAWQDFAGHRATYAARLNAVARYLASPPTLWIGDRTVLHEHLAD